MGREHLAKQFGSSRQPSRLAAGGVYGLWMKTGHSEVTEDAAEHLGFSSAAVSVMRDAVQDPDFYEWDHPRAHAQSPNGIDYLVGDARSTAEAHAVAAYETWSLTVVARLRAAGTDTRTALYWLGYLLHGIQDLATHAGRTNAEHSAGPDPDSEPDNIELARNYSLRTLRALRSALGAAAFGRLRSWDGDGAFSRATKVKTLHGQDWDLSIAALRKYSDAGKRYAAKRPPGGGIRWSRERVLVGLLERISGAPAKKAARTSPPRPSRRPRTRAAVRRQPRER